MGAIYMNGVCFGASDFDSIPVISLTYAEYEALSEDKKNNGDVYFITDAIGDFKDFQPVVYSEEEREIGVWTDGKPLYEKTVSFSVTDNNAFDYAINISGVDSTSVMHIVEGFFLCGENRRELNFEIASNYMAYTNLDYYTTDNKYHIGGLIKGYSGTCYATIRYTKTTDTAGSGQWTPQGVPAVHYSEDEHVVGTWIDGSTLYEKTYLVSSSISIGTSWTDTGFELPVNTDRVIEGFMYRNANAGALMYGAFSIGSNYQLRALFAVADNLDVGSSITVRYTKSSS